jgi:hypothetical protein
MNTVTISHQGVALRNRAKPAAYLEQLAAAEVSRDEAGVTYDKDKPPFAPPPRPEGSTDAPRPPNASRGNVVARRVVVARPVQPVPRDQWPLVVKAMALAAKPEDKGVGDTAKRMLAGMGADALAKLYEQATGRECGCKDRAARLNALYPY